MRNFIHTICLWLISLTASATITHEHFIPVKSIAPALKNQTVKLYLREVKAPDIKSRGAVLFIHGAATPSQAAFDLPYKDYSWMSYLANEGFAVYALDLTGYGRSTRPAEMNDPCNLPESEQHQFIPALLQQTCAKTHSQALTTNESDWADMDTAVNFILARENLPSLALIGWSQGGPRSLIYTQQHSQKINNLVLFAPAYGRDWPLTKTSGAVLSNLFFSTNQEEFIKGWDKQIGCQNQFDMTAREHVWKEMLVADGLGATWGSGVRRAPEQVWRWGFNAAVAAKMTKPVLLMIGEFDKQVVPQRVNELYEDLGSSRKVLVQLGCSSHLANWETNHLLMFKASADWLKDTAIEGKTKGVLKLGYSRAKQAQITQ